MDRETMADNLRYKHLIEHSWIKRAGYWQKSYRTRIPGSSYMTDIQEWRLDYNINCLSEDRVIYDDLHGLCQLITMDDSRQ